MRRVSILIGVCMLASLVLTTIAQQRDLSAIMKDINPAVRALNMDITNKDAATAATDATKLSGLFKEAGAFFKTKNIADATGWANDASSAAADAAKAAKANNFDDATKAAKTVGGTCKACHDVHREQLPDKTFKLKP